MAQLRTRSIGLQVNLCQCTLALPGGNIPTGNSNIDALVLPTATTSNAEADKYKDKDTEDPEMASNVNEDEAVETDHLLAGENRTMTEEAPNNSTTEATGHNSHSTPPKQAPPSQVPTSSGETTPKTKEHSHHHFQFKRKFNFRSDSVFSDVLPSSSSQDGQKPPGDSEKSGSLSSLKPKESKWVTLKRKLGKLNSSPASSTACKDKEKSKLTALENRAASKAGGIHEKRSLLQRAKTLSILPTNRLKEQREDMPPKRHVRRPPEHPELFNVGGEIDMIPLELLIDINDLKK